MFSKTKRLVRGGLAAALVLGSSAAVSAAENPGLGIGKKAPDFTLKDQSGQEVSLEGLLKQNKVALVFHRSANW